MKTNASFACALFLLPGLASYLPSALAGGGFNSKCEYSHTRPDDSIVRYGKPGAAMEHDFFGNAGTDAFSDYERLQAYKVTTCNVGGDLSAYWAPQLKRASGIIAPDFAKIYYKDDQPVVPLSAIPPGLQMLAGDHKGTGPKPQINYLCRGSGYTTVAPTNCPVVTDAQGTYAQLNISIHFPDCWNGKQVRPVHANDSDHMGYMAFIDYMAYRKADGTCPADFPVKLPELQMNIQYSLGQDPDLSTAQLSMDPILVDGELVPQWGSLYTAHADFINAWKVESMKYAIDLCANSNYECSNNVPTYYSIANEDGWLDEKGTSSMSGPSLQVGPGDVIFLKFPTPEHTDTYPWNTASLESLGANTTNTTAVMLDIYKANTVWSEQDDQAPKAAECTTQRIGGIYLNQKETRRLSDVTSTVRTAISAGQSHIALCIRNKTGTTVKFSSREGSFAPLLFLK